MQRPLVGATGRSPVPGTQPVDVTNHRTAGRRATCRSPLLQRYRPRVDILLLADQRQAVGDGEQLVAGFDPVGGEALFAPGRSDALHAHADAEEHLYVTYKVGDYLFRPAGVPHQTSSHIGVETLLVYVKRRDGA